MDLPAFAYLYSLAVMAMTFVGFTAIVMILRRGALRSRFDTLVARCFMVWGFVIAFFAMLPPLLAAFELSQPLVWRAAGAKSRRLRRPIAPITAKVYAPSGQQWGGDAMKVISWAL